ncbi:MAG: hypothetical protein ACFB0C_21890 [Leptolyngbyaceae cyanobacterium]
MNSSEQGESLDQFLAAIAPGASLASVDWTEIIYPDTPPAYLSDNDRIQTEYTQDGWGKASIIVQIRLRSCDGRKTSLKGDPTFIIQASRYL